MFKPTYCLALVLLLLAGCKETAQEEEMAQPYCLSKSLKESLTFETLSLQPVQQTISLTGTIEYNTDQTFPYVSLLEGVVTATYFSLGDYVKKGQLLAEIKSTSFNEMQDQNRSLSSQVQVAQRKLQAVKSMYDDGIASESELLEAQSDLAVLHSNWSSVKSSMQLYSASSEKSVFQVIAPTDGYIVSKNISSGMPIAAGEEALFTISNLSEVWIMANVYAANMRHVTQNAPVVIKTLAYPDEKFEGKITTISRVFNEDERVLKARISMPNTDMKLKPGMSADIVLSIDQNGHKAIAIPNSAIIFDNNQSYVVIYQDDCHLEIRQIKSSSRNDFYTYVEQGVKANEKIVTTNELLLFEALKVRAN